MHNTILLLHSWLRWVVLALLVIAILQAFQGWFKQTAWTDQHKRINLFTMIAADVQLLLGLLLYFVSGPWSQSLFSNTKMVMKTRSLRYFAVEHLFLMLLALVLIHVGYARAKRLTDATQKHKAAALFFLFALIAILASIPWPFLSQVGRPWFRF